MKGDCLQSVHIQHNTKERVNWEPLSLPFAPHGAIGLTDIIHYIQERMKGESESTIHGSLPMKII